MLLKFEQTTVTFTEGAFAMFINLKPAAISLPLIISSLVLSASAAEPLLETTNAVGKVGLEGRATNERLTNRESPKQYISQVGTQSQFHMGAGRTTPGATNWQPYGTNGIYLDVDTSSAGFTTTPVYVTSIGGDGWHWLTTGATSIYQASPTSFRVYVRFSDGSSLTPAQANGLRWHINWIAMPQ